MLRFSWRAVRVALSIGGCAFVGTVACQAFVTLEGKSDDASGRPESGTVEGVDPCAAFPPRPEPNSTDAAVRAPIEFAIYAWSIEDISHPDLCRVAGHDLDGVNTGPEGSCDEVALCRAPVSGARAACDRPNGIDNALSSVLGRIRELEGRIDVKLLDANALLARAYVNIILKLHDYNGEANDEKVTLRFFGSSGHTNLPDAGTGNQSIKDVLAMPPVWDGGQDLRWVIDESAVHVDQGFQDARQIATGYVRDWILVIPKAGDGVFPIGSVGPDLRYTDGVLSARIHPPQSPHGKWRLTHGRLGGRAPSSQILTVIGAGQHPIDPGQFCQQTPVVLTTYSYARNVFCENLDLARIAPPPDGGTGAGASCADFSAGMTFASIESPIARNPDNTVAVSKSHLKTAPPCPEAGTIWCDDCEWDASRRCDYAAGENGSEDAGALDASDASTD